MTDSLSTLSRAAIEDQCAAMRAEADECVKDAVSFRSLANTAARRKFLRSEDRGAISDLRSKANDLFAHARDLRANANRLAQRAALERKGAGT